MDSVLRHLSHLLVSHKYVAENKPFFIDEITIQFPVILPPFVQGRIKPHLILYTLKVLYLDIIMNAA